MVFPVVLGSGKRLFGPSAGKKPLKLAESRTVGDGIADPHLRACLSASGRNPEAGAELTGECLIPGHGRGAGEPCFRGEPTFGWGRKLLQRQPVS